MKENLVPMPGIERLEDLKKEYRILYWLGSIKTEKYVRANNKEEAEIKFRELKGDKNIIEIEEV